MKKELYKEVIEMFDKYGILYDDGRCYDDDQNEIGYWISIPSQDFHFLDDEEYTNIHYWETL